MFARLRTPRRTAVKLLALAAAGLMAACQPIALGNGDGGPRINSNDPVPVALLVPAGSGKSGDDLLAKAIENAARLAIADLDGVKIDLRVYNTAGNPSTAAGVAQRAVDAGAKVILGPVYSASANAVGVAVADEGVNVLSFSNNPDIAGGNVFVLGPTFENTANRLVAYARSQGRGNIFTVHAQSLAEEIGRDAIAKAISQNGASNAGSASFELSQQGLIAAVPKIVSQAKASGADAVFFTSTNDGAMPFLAQLLPEAGLSPSATQFIGLGRLDIPTEALTQPGLQGSWFAMPDPNLYGNFRGRYQQAYGGVPHPIASLAYDGIAAIGALVARQGNTALTRSALTQGSGFVGTGGIFRLRNDGTNQRGLAVAQIRNNQVVIINAAPRSFSGAGF
ncbi:penicillin-binding protein activator [Vannielia sp.]|uniref:penicillin-binding protein activator n=1 Tax=Vannielia sp. TaxID=2813045 RepID=UPI00262F9E8C|nr:penicillin-binding protein activator [Vannielia sp.]MDF1872731.1 penicillin-binding protein activator [Vannielia sp.]